MKVQEAIDSRPVGITVLERGGTFAAASDERCTPAQFAEWAELVKSCEDLAFATSFGDDGLSFATNESIQNTRVAYSKLAVALGCDFYGKVLLWDEETTAANADELAKHQYTDREIMFGLLLGFIMGGLPPKGQVAALRGGEALALLPSINNTSITQLMLSEFASEVEAHYETQSEKA